MDVLEPLVLNNRALLKKDAVEDFEEMVNKIRCLKSDKCLSLDQVVEAVKLWPQQSPQTYKQDVDALIANLMTMSEARQ